MERAYHIEIAVAGVLAATSVLVGAAILAKILPAPLEPPVWIFYVYIPFVSVNVLLRVASDSPLRFPWPRMRDAVTAIAVGTFLAMASYGVVTWPAAPVRMNGQQYVDKGGRPHSEASFKAFKRWEAAFSFLGMPVGLVAFTNLPAMRRRAKKAA